MQAFPGSASYHVQNMQLQVVIEICAAGKVAERGKVLLL